MHKVLYADSIALHLTEYAPAYLVQALDSRLQPLQPLLVLRSQALIARAKDYFDLLFRAIYDHCAAVHVLKRYTTAYTEGC
jgi:hypothetical protein